MAGLFDRTGRPMLEDRACFRADHDYGLCYWIALWAQGGRVRLLGGDDVVGHSTYMLVRIWNTGFLPRHSPNCWPADGVRDHCWMVCLCGGGNLRSILFSLG